MLVDRADVGVGREDANATRKPAQISTQRAVPVVFRDIDRVQWNTSDPMQVEYLFQRENRKMGSQLYTVRRRVVSDLFSFQVQVFFGVLTLPLECRCS